MADNLATDENTKLALKVLRETFHFHSLAPLPLRAPSTAGSAHSGASCEEVIASPILFDDPPTTSTHPSSPVAPPLPVSKQLHPARSLFNAISQRRVSASAVPRSSVSGMVAGIINQIRKESPLVSPTFGETETSVNAGQNDCVYDDEIDDLPLLLNPIVQGLLILLLILLLTQTPVLLLNPM